MRGDSHKSSKDSCGWTPQARSMPRGSAWVLSGGSFEGLFFFSLRGVRRPLSPIGKWSGAKGNHWRMKRPRPLATRPLDDPLKRLNHGWAESSITRLACAVLFRRGSFWTGYNGGNAPLSVYEHSNQIRFLLSAGTVGLPFSLAGGRASPPSRHRLPRGR